MHESDQPTGSEGIERIGPDESDPLAAALREQGKRRREEAPAGLSARVLATWRVEAREVTVISFPRASATGAKMALAAACVLLVGGAALLARLDGNASVEPPAASTVLSTSLRALPKPAESMMKLASMPLRREATALTAGTRRALGGLDVFRRSIGP